MNNNDVLNVNLKNSEKEINKTMETTVEKHYCYDHPSAYNNHDALAIAAMANRCNNNDPMAMMAAMNGGMGGQWNNPFIYLVWMMFAQRMWNQNGGFNAADSAQFQELQAQLAALRNQMQDNQNSNMIMDAVKGTNVQIGQLAQQLNCDFNALNGAICDVRGGIDRLSGQVGFSAEKIINAGLLGDQNIVQQLQNCCCQVKELVQSQGYQNQLGQKDIQFGIQKTGCDLLAEMQRIGAYTNTGLERGFSSVAYATQQQTCELKTNQDANTQRIIDTLNNHWNQELANKLQKAEFENSQLKQNNYIASLFNGGCGCGVNNQ